MKLIDLSEDVLTKLKMYLQNELSISFSERADLQDRIVSEQRDYWAEPSGEDSSYPFQGASSLIVPLGAITVEAYHAKIMGSIFALDELVTIKTNEENEHLRGGLKILFNHEFQHSLKFKEKIESPTLELEKHGTGIAAVGYRKTKKVAVVQRENEDDLHIPVLVENGTCIDGIPLCDFLMPFYATSVESSPWVGNLVRLTERDILQWEGQGWFYEGTYDKFKQYLQGTTTSQNLKLNQVREDTDTEPVFPAEIELKRIFLEWDTSNDGDLKCIEVYYHEESMTVCGVSYNSDRPYEAGVLFPLEYRWYGIGLLKQIQLFQLEVTTIHRQRLDGNAIANMKMFKIKRSAQSYIKDDEPIFPGKKWWVENMDDIQELNIGSVSPASYNDENQIVIYAQQRSGINDLTLGMPGVGTPGTASESIARVQESTKKSDYSQNNIKDWQNRIIDRAVLSIAKHGPKEISTYDLLPEGGQIEQFLKGYAQNPSKLLLNVSLAGSKNNKVLDRNTMTQLAGTQVQYWTNIISLVQQLGDPNVIQQVVKKAIESAGEINKEILLAFDIPNPEKLIVNLNQLGGTSQEQTGIDPTTGLPTVNNSNTTVLAPNSGLQVGQGTPNVSVGPQY